MAGACATGGRSFNQAERTVRPVRATSVAWCASVPLCMTFRAQLEDQVLPRCFASFNALASNGEYFELAGRKRSPSRR